MNINELNIDEPVNLGRGTSKNSGAAVHPWTVHQDMD